MVRITVFTQGHRMRTVDTVGQWCYNIVRGVIPLVEAGPVLCICKSPHQTWCAKIPSFKFLIVYMCCGKTTERFSFCLSRLGLLLVDHCDQFLYSICYSLSVVVDVV